MGIPNMVRLKRITIYVNIVNRKRYTICDDFFPEIYLVVCRIINPNEFCHTGTQDIFEPPTVHGGQRLGRRGSVNGN